MFVAWVAVLTLMCLAAAESTSPFILYSTAQLNIPALKSSSELTTNNDIHHLILVALGSCPTSHYAVIFQSGVSAADFEHEDFTPYITSLANQPTGLKIRDIHGQVDVVGIVNTILMDCLHHGIKGVQNLETNGLVVHEIDAETVAESVIYADMPKLSDAGKREAVLSEHDGYVEKAVRTYFGGKDYTLIYITKPASNDGKDEMPGSGALHGSGAELPLVQEE